MRIILLGMMVGSTKYSHGISLSGDKEYVCNCGEDKFEPEEYDVCANKNAKLAEDNDGLIKDIDGFKKENPVIQTWTTAEAARSVQIAKCIQGVDVLKDSCFSSFNQVRLFFDDMKADFETQEMVDLYTNVPNLLHDPTDDTSFIRAPISQYQSYIAKVVPEDLDTVVDEYEKLEELINECSAESMLSRNSIDSDYSEQIKIVRYVAQRYCDRRGIHKDAEVSCEEEVREVRDRYNVVSEQLLRSTVPALRDLLKVTPTITRVVQAITSINTEVDLVVDSIFTTSSSLVNALGLPTFKCAALKTTVENLKNRSVALEEVNKAAANLVKSLKAAGHLH